MPGDKSHFFLQPYRYPIFPQLMPRIEKDMQKENLIKHMQRASSKTHLWNDIMVKQIIKGNWVQLQ